MHSVQARFPGLVDLASAALGGKALACSDDFFAEMQNMLLPAPAVFDPDRYTDRGKWMDGWESRRKRSAGHDHCVIELGCAGEVLGFDIDTSHFLGNHPPYASVDGLMAPSGTEPAALPEEQWRPLLAQVPLSPGCQNLFIAARSEPVSHLRLNIFPDGGVARFRAYGRVLPDPGRVTIDEEALAAAAGEAGAERWTDLVSVLAGGVGQACSDAFYGPVNNLLLPGRAVNMGGGWETRRRRGPGHDWVVLKLGTRGTPKLVEIDTNHFKGNYPDRFSLDVLDAPDLPLTELISSTRWQPALPEHKLGASQRAFFRDRLSLPGPISHVRVNIMPDGGLSRVRLWGVADG